jgi:hypothetical protein
MQVILCEENKVGMECHFMGVGIQNSIQLEEM